MDPITAPSGTHLATARAPALAYENPQPRLPGSEADPPRQPETFVRRARRVRLGSHHLKTGYLALCTFGRGWVKEEDRIEIRMKRQTMAGELECRPQTLAALLRDLQAAGVVEFCRAKYHTVVTLFCEPRPRVSAETAPTEAASSGPASAETAPTEAASGGPASAETAPTEPSPGGPASAETAPTEAASGGPASAETAPTEAASGGPASAETAPTEPSPGGPASAETALAVGAESAPTKVFGISSQQQQQDSPSTKQLRGIRSMGDELRSVDVNPFGRNDPPTRTEADEIFRERKRQVAELRADGRSGSRRRGQENYPRQLKRQPAALASNAVGRIRNCPACRSVDRGAECHCKSCGWRESGCTCDFDVGAGPSC